MAIMGGLKTADSLAARGISMNDTCALCHSYAETVSHLFFEFDFSFSILSNLMKNLGFLLLRPNILKIFEYIEDMKHKDKNFYFLIICCVVYRIWRERNERKFGEAYVSSTTLAQKIKTAVLSKILNMEKGRRSD
ncbi:hypothetical protein MA16_Dca025137 [Dendrobium catenatum]|uniref:Reverse transcriptase zinc-binding domain-containing protein n=1 Tax=Dendrobium catenatum TaxID=906689 RepID=A0A2I0VTE9_9ASPA|nr:hypothetical protein MA16_Dca025137 [Dendrobium catenatum]